MEGGRFSAEMIPKPPTPILDRFRALLKEREEELRASDDEDDILQPTIQDIVQLYEVVLSELNFNSKPMITELTIIAGEQKEYAEGIADAICARILQAPIEQKLPSLYLLDSIVKNIGFEYNRYFALRLPEVFCEAYRQVPPNQYRAMRHLFGTWSTVFPPSVLRKIGAELQFSPLANLQSTASASSRSSESASPRPTHGIHVNPKYLEARRQLEEANMRVTDANFSAARMTSYEGERMDLNASAVPKGWSGASSRFEDLQNARGISSSLQRYGQKPPFGHDEYDVDHAEIISDQVGIRRLGSPGIAARASVGGAERLIPSKGKPLRPSSPSKAESTESLSPSYDGFQTENSPSRTVERASPSHCGYEYGPGRVSKRDEEKNDWWTKHTLDSNRKHIESGVYHLSNGSDEQRPRALIDAYGNCRGKSFLAEKPLRVERLGVNGLNNNAAARKWQNTEEEEYVWEEMNPTLANNSRTNDLMASKPPLGNIGTRAGSGKPSDVLSESNFEMGNWPSRPQLPVVDDSAARDGITNLGSSGGAIGEKPVYGLGTQFNATQLQGSHHSQEPWNLQHNFRQTLQQHDVKATSFPSPGTFLSVSQRMPSLMDNKEVLSSATSTTMLKQHLRQRPRSPPMAPHIWPPVNVHKSYPPHSLPVHPQQHQAKGQFDLLGPNKSLVFQVPNDSSLLPQQQFDAVEGKGLNSMLHLPHRLGALSSFNNQIQDQVAPSMPQVLKPQDAPESLNPRLLPQVPSHFTAQHFTGGHPLQGQGPHINHFPLNKIPGVSLVPMHGVPNTSFQLQGGALPPLPPGPPPASFQTGPSSQSTGPIASHPPGGNAFSGLLSSLMAQGLISLKAPVSVQDSVGLEFNADVLKVRHESAIKALYADLPRQCTTCGLRFKCQEEHSAHMDWHVTKNRVSKNRKQKSSRNWFVSTSIWLSSAEAIGSEAVPGFLPTESVLEKKDDEDLAVPADENQNACALCGELFDDFYSDETEEWMYKGAVYLNVPIGSTGGMDRSQLGPIVHAKCRSESTVVSPEGFGIDERGKTEEGTQSKRMRF